MEKQHRQILSKIEGPQMYFQLMQDLAKRWLAHDGMWFQAIEKEYGMEAAIQMDAVAWERFAPLEADRILKFFHLPKNGGLPVLKEALSLRLHAFIHQQEIIDVDENRFILRMTECRVQSARNRKNMPDFPCKSVGLVEYTGFAKAIDSRIQVRCVSCPPDLHPQDYYCAWEFWIE